MKLTEKELEEVESMAHDLRQLWERNEVAFSHMPSIAGLRNIGTLALLAKQVIDKRSVGVSEKIWVENNEERPIEAGSYETVNSSGENVRNWFENGHWLILDWKPVVKWKRKNSRKTQDSRKRNLKMRADAVITKEATDLFEKLGGEPFIDWPPGTNDMTMYCNLTGHGHLDNGHLDYEEVTIQELRALAKKKTAEQFYRDWAGWGEKDYLAEQRVNPSDLFGLMDAYADQKYGR